MKRISFPLQTSQPLCQYFIPNSEYGCWKTLLVEKDFHSPQGTKKRLVFIIFEPSLNFDSIAKCVYRKLALTLRSRLLKYCNDSFTTAKIQEIQRTLE